MNLLCNVLKCLFIHDFLEICKLVLAGRMGEAITMTQQIYPGLLERDLNLMFTLKSRQFVEMVNGTDSEMRPARSPKSQGNSPCMSPSYQRCSRGSSPQPIQTSVIKSVQSVTQQTISEIGETGDELSVEEMNAINSKVSSSSSTSQGPEKILPPQPESVIKLVTFSTTDTDMDVMDTNTSESSVTNGTSNGCAPDNDNANAENGDTSAGVEEMGKSYLCRFY